MRLALIAVAVTVLVGACGASSQDGPTVYYGTADANGWAVVSVEGYVFGDVIDARAWRVQEYCEDCDPILWEVDTVVMLDGSVGANTEPNALVMFVVDLLPDTS
jgi:hypothetical protein